MRRANRSSSFDLSRAPLTSSQRVQDRLLRYYREENYVGTVLAPKAMVPVSAWAADPGLTDWEFACFSPDRSRWIGKGYFAERAERGPKNCIRQHMHPGLSTPKLQGTGLGTALYLCGNMTIAAMYDDADGEFPWTDRQAKQCTFSIDAGRGEDDRTPDAAAVWKSLANHGLATRVNIPKEEAYADLDPMYVSDLAATIIYDSMDWSTIAASGLVIHMGLFFREPIEHAFIPPAVFASLDWRFTKIEQFEMFALQNAELSGDKNAWLIEAACHLNETLPSAAQILIQQTRQKKFPNQCPIVFREDDRDWIRQWGDYEEEQEPRMKTMKAKLLR